MSPHPPPPPVICFLPFLPHVDSRLPRLPQLRLVLHGPVDDDAAAAAAGRGGDVAGTDAVRQGARRLPRLRGSVQVGGWVGGKKKTFKLQVGLLLESVFFQGGLHRPQHQDATGIGPPVLAIVSADRQSCLEVLT